jgi:hypothetical protein
VVVWTSGSTFTLEYWKERHPVPCWKIDSIGDKEKRPEGWYFTQIMIEKTFGTV